MHKILTSIILLFVATAALADDPRRVVFKYECAQIDAKVTGFECRYDSDGMTLAWMHDPKGFAQRKKERASYEFNKIALRYIELGGPRFTVLPFNTPKNKKNMCAARQQRTTFFCQSMTCRDIEGGGQTCG